MQANRPLTLGFGIALLGYGLLLCVFSVIGAHPTGPSAWAERLYVCVLLSTCLLMLPFITAFSRFNLVEGRRQGDEDVQEREAQTRWKLLSKCSRWWPWVWYAPLALVLVGWALFLTGLHVFHPLLLFCAAVNLISGLWFTTVHSTASRLFSLPPRRA